MYLRRYLDEKKKNAGEAPPLPLLVAMNIYIATDCRGNELPA